MTERNISRDGLRRQTLEQGRVRKSKHNMVTQVLKYVILITIISFIIILMLFASGSSKPFDQLEKAVESSIDSQNMKKTETQGLKRYYGLTSADYDGVMLYVSESSISTEEVLLVKVKSEGQMQRLEEAVAKRLESRKADFEGYAPEQVQLLEQVQISVRGKYLFMAVSPNAEAYKDAFAKSL